MHVACSAALRLTLLSTALALCACATLSDRSAANHAVDGDAIPDGAEPVTHRESNGDVVTEYRVAGQLRLIKVEPSNGPVYYVYDRDGDGVPDKAGDNPPQTYFKLFGWK